MGTRHKAREFALQILYQVDLRDEALQGIVDLFFQTTESVEEERKYAEFLAQGVVIRRNELDDLIEGAALNWRMERMSVVDRNILRMGAYEILHQKDVPRTVVIDECIELAKTFSAQESGGFINGILDKIGSA